MARAEEEAVACLPFGQGLMEPRASRGGIVVVELSYWK